MDIILVLFFQNSLKTFKKIFFPTYASNADKASSISIISGFAYIIQAIEILCFYPPDKFIPLSPINVLSPAGRILKSGFNSHIFKTFLYFSSSNGKPKTIFSLNDALRRKEF